MRIAEASTKDDDDYEAMMDDATDSQQKNLRPTHCVGVNLNWINSIRNKFMALLLQFKLLSDQTRTHLIRTATAAGDSESGAVSHLYRHPVHINSRVIKLLNWTVCSTVEIGPMQCLQPMMIIIVLVVDGYSMAEA